VSDALDILDQTPTIRPDNEVIYSYANFDRGVQTGGHGLQSELHGGDPWVAA